MLETLHTSTMVTGYGLLASPAITSTSGIKLEKDKEGKVEAIGFKVTPTIIGAVASSATIGTGFSQEASYQNVLNSVRDTQAYVESLDDEKLAELSAMLDDKELTFTEKDQLLLEKKQIADKTLIKK